MTNTPDGPAESGREFDEIVAESTDEPAPAKDHEDTVTEAKYQLLAAGDQVRDKADQVREATKTKADQVLTAAEEQARQVAEKVESSVPEPVADRGKQAIRRIPVAAAAVSAAALVYWLVRRRR